MASEKKHKTISITKKVNAWTFILHYFILHAKGHPGLGLLVSRAKFDRDRG